MKGSIGNKKNIQKSMIRLMSPNRNLENKLNHDNLLPLLSPGKSLRPQTSIILSQLDPTNTKPVVQKKSVVPSKPIQGSNLGPKLVVTPKSRMGILNTNTSDDIKGRNVSESRGNEFCNRKYLIL